MRLKALLARSPQEWFSSLPITILLLAVVVFGTGELIHSQLLGLGNSIWPGYHELRKDPVAPNCVRNGDIEAMLQQRIAEQAEEAEEDDFGMFDDEPLDPEIIRASLINAKESCEEKFLSFEDRQGKITGGLTIFRSVEAAVASLSDISLHANRYIMLFMLLITAITSTLVRDHIALRPMRTRKDMQVSLSAQMIGNAFIFISALRYRDIQLDAGIALTTMQIVAQWAYIIGFGALSMASLWQIIRIPHTESEPGGSYPKALLSIPLYTFMALVSGIFFFAEGHRSGIIIYLNKMMDLSGVFINLGLYVWVGMLLKQTRLASLVFDTFRPWKMPPEILAFFAILVSALPTAYTGGSAIYVIAAGAVIYNELRRAGSRRQLALATTAMSGSMGIVLNPCLMIVLIAALNKEVITSARGDISIFDFDKIGTEWGLFDAGFWLFLISAIIFLVVALIANRPKIEFAPARQAIPEMLQLFKPIVPYVIVILAVALGYRWLLDAKLDEFSAPIILPTIMLAVLLYDQFYEKKTISKNYSVRKGFEHGVRNATNETTAHIGALLMLMGMSICVGAPLEGDGSMPTLTEGTSLWMTVTMLVFILVGIGMFMDPMGAIILVSIGLAKFAYNAGVHPLHFWMITLMAFELGYLSPPVALNHLMTRHVVGEEEFDLAAEEAKSQTFYQRHERLLLPIIVMAISLLLTAFVPLFFYA